MSRQFMRNTATKLCDIDSIVLYFIFSVVVLMWIPTFIRSLEGEFVHSWAYTELLVNWSGGFVRRGLYGTMAISFHELTGLGVVRLTAIVFILTTLAQIIFLFWLLRQYRPNYLLLVAVGLSPTMLLFAVYDNAAYWRKESFMLLGILVHSILARQFLCDNVSYSSYMRLFVFVLVPMLIINTLIWEPQGLFIPVHIALSLSVIRKYTLMNATYGWHKTKPIFIGYLLIFIVFVSSIFAHGDKHKSSIMFDSIKSWSGAPADLGFPGWTNAIDAHSMSLTETYGSARSVITDTPSFLAYLGAFLVGPVMLALIIRNNIDKHDKYSNHVWPMILPLILFLIGNDYGRWINMIAVSVVAYLLHFPSKLTPQIYEGQSIYSWVPPFLLISGVAVYTLGWHLPHSGANRTFFGASFFTVWHQLFDILGTLMD